MNDMICCPQCKGAGEVELRTLKWLAETLSVLREQGPHTASELRPKVSRKILVTGMNNRLEDLRSLGFVERTKRGKEWLYSAK